MVRRIGPVWPWGMPVNDQTGFHIKSEKQGKAGEPF